MRHKLRRLLGWFGLVASFLGAIQACGDSSGNSAAHGGGSGDAGAASGEAGATSSSGAGGSAAGSANGGNGTAGKASAGDAGNAGAGGGGADAGAGGNASAGAGGSDGVTCHLSWTGAATGEADCTHIEVCHHNFLSLGIVKPAAPAPLKSIQLIYSPTELTLGNFAAMAMDMVNCGVQVNDAGVAYAPKYDAQNQLSDGTSMTGTLTDLQFSADENDPCAGTAHGSFDVVLPETNSANKLTLHAEF